MVKEDYNLPLLLATPKLGQVAFASPDCKLLPNRTKAELPIHTILQG
jgi:hypothetical protein